MSAEEKASLWDKACDAWDQELLSTEDIKRMADMLFSGPELTYIQEEIDVADVTLV